MGLLFAAALAASLHAPADIRTGADLLAACSSDGEARAACDRFIADAKAHDRRFQCMFVGDEPRLRVLIVDGLRDGALNDEPARDAMAVALAFDPCS